MASRFQVMQPEGYVVDLDDILMRREYISDGTLWVWGRDQYGQLGVNSTTNYSSPITTSGGGINWKQVSGSFFHLGAIKSDGTLWTWGDARFGALGKNTATGTVTSPTTTSGGGTNWKLTAFGFAISSAIKTDGTLWTWGSNSAGQLGTNNITNYSSPVTTSGGGTNWKNISVGSPSLGSGFFTAIKTDGTLWVFGLNTSGQLGTNDTTNYSSPVTTNGGGTNWKQIASGLGYAHSSAIKTDGTLWVWGGNNYGQLGTNNTTNYSSPITTVASGTNWNQVSCGYYNTAAIKTDGTLWTWGRNNSGQLGVNDTSNRSSPVTVSGGGTNWKQISIGSSCSGIKTDGTMWSFGSSGSGTLGVNNMSGYSSPVTISGGGTNWKFVETGGVTAAALTDITF